MHLNAAQTQDVKLESLHQPDAAYNCREHSNRCRCKSSKSKESISCSRTQAEMNGIVIFINTHLKCSFYICIYAHKYQE